MKEPYLLRIPTEVKAKLTAKAGEIGISLNALILQILWAYLEGGAENGNRKSDGE
jgi:predicted HicB family RNase H-like nuclease